MVSAPNLPGKSHPSWLSVCHLPWKSHTSSYHTVSLLDLLLPLLGKTAYPRVGRQPRDCDSDPFQFIQKYSRTRGPWLPHTPRPPFLKTPCLTGLHTALRFAGCHFFNPSYPCDLIAPSDWLPVCFAQEVLLYKNLYLFYTFLFLFSVYRKECTKVHTHILGIYTLYL